MFIVIHISISQGDRYFEFSWCLYSFIDFTGEIDKWDERKSNGAAHWELHQTSLSSSPIDLSFEAIEE